MVVAPYKFHIFNRNIYFHDFYKNYSLYIVWFVEWSNLYDFLSNGISEILPRSITKKSFKERSLIISLYKFKGANWSLDRWLHHLHCPPGCPVSSETICCWKSKTKWGDQKFTLTESFVWRKRWRARFARTSLTWRSFCRKSANLRTRFKLFFVVSCWTTLS